MISIFLLGCATTKKAVWNTAPESTYPYSMAWPIIKTIIATKYTIKEADGGAGYIETEWEVKRGSLGNSKSRTRLVLQVKSAKPVRFDFKFEKEKHKSLTGTLIGTWSKNWKADGNDLEMENELRREFSLKLRYR